MTVCKLLMIAIASLCFILASGLATAEEAPGEWSRTRPYPLHEVYYPGTGALAADVKPGLTAVPFMDKKIKRLIQMRGRFTCYVV